jgi:hypothetical protein
MLFKNSVRTSKRTLHFTITKINWLTLFREMIAVYSENHTKTHKYKMQHCWMSKQMVHIVTARPSYTPRHWVPILVTFYDMHGLQWDYSLVPATARYSFQPTQLQLFNMCHTSAHLLLLNFNKPVTFCALNGRSFACEFWLNYATRPGSSNLVSRATSESGSAGTQVWQIATVLLVRLGSSVSIGRVTSLP